MSSKKSIKLLEKKLFKKYSGLAIRVAVPLSLLGLIISLLPSSNYRPTVAREYAETSVKVVRKDFRSGGSGVILESNSDYSLVLTNKHVCRVIAKGGFIEKEDGSTYLINDYKVSANHDLCLVRIRDDLGVNTSVADYGPEKYSRAHISGHPSLLPHVVTHSDFSGRIYIQVLMGYRDCTPEEQMKYIECIFLGKLPVVKAFDSQLVTGTIMPGSSGSAIFDNDGKIAGLVFAGTGRGLSYAFAVPRQYITAFLEEELVTLKWRRADKSNPTISEDFEYSSVVFSPTVISY